MFSTNFCGLRSYSGNQLDWICTMIRWPGSNTWLTVGRVNLYSCVFPAGIAEGCSKLSRYRPRKISMASRKNISGGVADRLPADLQGVIASDAQALEAMEDITPLARNEWICWIESAKKVETRSRRIEWGCSSLKDGKRRPCCWPGCAHR